MREAYVLTVPSDGFLTRGYTEGFTRNYTIKDSIRLPFHETSLIFVTFDATPCLGEK